jgi:glutathione peroxidase
MQAGDPPIPSDVSLEVAVVNSAPELYTFSAPLLDGRSVSLDEFRGHVLLIVNTASECGFTPQYAGLESLYQAHRRRGFSVLAFPCNQFGGQEPGSAAQIQSFCRQNYGVSFPVFQKIDVNGQDAHPLFRFLKRKKPGALGLFTGGRISWNFTKFLCGCTGQVEARFAPSTRPERLTSTIEQLLNNR